MTELNKVMCILLACSELALGARILAFLPIPAKSHHFAFQPLLRQLALRGHQVDYFTAIPIPDPPKNLRHIEIKDFMAVAESESKIMMKQMMEMTILEQSLFIEEMCLWLSEKVFTEEPKTHELLTSNVEYDVVLMNTFFGQDWASALTHRFNAKGIAISPLGDVTWGNELAGLPDNPAYMIDMKARTSDQMTFFERLHNVYIWMTTMAVSYYYGVFRMQQFADQHLRYEGWESRPSVLEMSSDVALMLMNSHHSLGYSFPKAPHVKEVGGMHVAQSNKPLPQDLQTFMDSATNGVIYFSYGSIVNVDELTRDGKLDAFVKVFKTLKQNVLWKWKGSEIPKIEAPNVRIEAWFPQQDILAHKNTKLFITHGGLMSLTEAVHHGVPLIGTAIFGDQPKNLKFVEHAGIGIHLQYHNISEVSLKWAINEVLTNPNYSTAMKKRQELFKDRPMKPVDEAVYWVEYVVKHGKVLQPASVHMPFYQLYLLDVMGFLLGSLLIITWVIRWTFGLLCSLWQRKREGEVQKKIQ